MSASAAVALAAVLAAGRADDAPARADDSVARPNDAAGPFIRLVLLGEGAFSAAHAERGVLAYGGRLTLRIGRLALVGSFDGPATASTVQPRFGGLALAGAGLVHDLSSRLGLHWALVGGLNWVGIDDYVNGGWRSVSDLAAGVRAGLEWRLYGGVGRYPQLGFAPVLGASATVVYTGTGSDRLRGIEWGGLTAFLSLTLGYELATPPRSRPLASAPASRAGPAGDPIPAQRSSGGRAERQLWRRGGGGLGRTADVGAHARNRTLGKLGLGR